MDDQAVIRTYGNTNLPEGTEDRPLVTFALFAYNQEKYIREAVEGAFSQTYSPLEIILSDDCSSDRTFEIMEEMAAGYQGPHLVRVRRGEQNVGLAQHVKTVFESTLGELVIVAAGDDISRNTRTSRLVSAWCDADQPNCAVHSDATTIDSDGIFVGRLKGSTNAKKPSLEQFLSGGMRTPLIGATAGYTKENVLSWPDIHTNAFEDKILSFRALISGRIIYVPEELVAYRLHLQSITSQSAGGTTRRRNYARSQRDSVMQILFDYIDFCRRGSREPYIPFVNMIAKVAGDWNDQIRHADAIFPQRLYWDLRRPGANQRERLAVLFKSLGVSRSTK